MQDPVTLFHFEPHVDRRTVRADTLVVTLGNRVDAGHAQKAIQSHLLNALPNHLLGRFDADQLIDYTAHRPVIEFDRDHFTGYQAPTIDLHHVTDASGTPFLLLTGPEPSLQWERMVGTIDYLIDQFDIEQTVLLQAVPAPAPHTRPVHVTRYAGDPSLVPVEESLPMAFVTGAAFGGLLTIRLAEKGHNVTGLVAHVPHYISHANYPDAAISLLRRLTRSTHLDIPVGLLEAAQVSVRIQLEAEVNQSEETAEMVAQLEKQFDGFMAQRELTASVELPDAEEIGQQVEDFLRGLDSSD